MARTGSITSIRVAAQLRSQVRRRARSTHLGDPVHAQLAAFDQGRHATVTFVRQPFVLPRGVFHKPSSPAGAVVLLVEPVA